MHWQEKTRAVSVTIEKSPSGPSWTIRFADHARLWFRRFAFCSQADAIVLAAEKLDELHAGTEEKTRVLGLLVRELARKRQATVTAEVPMPATEARAA